MRNMLDLLHSFFMLSGAAIALVVLQQWPSQCGVDTVLTLHHGLAEYAKVRP